MRHPNLVNLKAICMHPPAIVMDYVPCGTLYELLQDDSIPITWSMKLKIAKDIAKALRYLHSMNPPRLHADLKSPNVLMQVAALDSDLNEEDLDTLVVAKLADFGLTIPMHINTLQKRLVDQPVWLAPEIMRATGKLDYIHH
jgi:serine/threonine protein kinase